MECGERWKKKETYTVGVGAEPVAGHSLVRGCHLPGWTPPLYMLAINIRQAVSGIS